MERNCLRTAYRSSLTTSNTTIDGGGGGEDIASLKSQRKVKMEEDFINGISWPPRSYKCNFCKREFRSAQALGGHMNVHRRDRALLYAPNPNDHHDGHFTNLNLNLNHNPNPNPNPNLPSHDDIVAFGRSFDRKASDLKAENEIVKPNWNNKGEKFIGLLDFIEISTSTPTPTLVLTDSNNVDIDLELRLGYSA